MYSRVHILIAVGRPGPGVKGYSHELRLSRAAVAEVGGAEK